MCYLGLHAPTHLRFTTSRPSSPQPKNHSLLNGRLRYAPLYITRSRIHCQSCPQVKEAAEQEWATFRLERSAGIEEIQTLRQRVQEEQLRVRVERETSSSPTKVNGDQEMHPTDSPTIETKPAAENGMDVDQTPADQSQEESPDKDKEAKKDREGTQATEAAKVEEKETALETSMVPAPAPMQADDDDAVEY